MSTEGPSTMRRVAEQSTSKQQTSGMEAALSYASRGWSVIPLHEPLAGGCTCDKPECDSVGKHPRLGWKDRSSKDPLQIRSWWRRWPQANVGIVTGAVSGDLLVLDIDGDRGAESLLALEAKHGPLPETWTVSTQEEVDVTSTSSVPAGTEATISASVIASGIDTRCNGGFGRGSAVAPRQRQALHLYHKR